MLKTQKAQLIQDQIWVISKLQNQANPNVEEIETAINSLTVLVGMQEIPFFQPVMDQKRLLWLQNIKEGDVVKFFYANAAYVDLEVVKKVSEKIVTVSRHNFSKEDGTYLLGDETRWIEPAD
jgi:hypothetical protein